jgi:hypothetical protein
MFIVGASDVVKGFWVVVLISNKLQDSIEGWAGPDVQSAQSNCKKAPCYMERICSLFSLSEGKKQNSLLECGKYSSQA